MVWQALGADPRLISAHSAAQRLDQEGRPPHLVWNPLTGDIAQLIPVVRAVCLLGAPESLEHGRSEPGPSLADAANRQGRLCVQVGVVAWAQKPFTDGPMYRVERILSWLHSWGVTVALARRPGRPVRADPHYRAQPRPLALGGHFGASQIPGWDAAGPGDIDIDLLGLAQATHCQVISRRRKPRPGMANRNHRVALETMLGPEIDADAAVPSVWANAPH